VQLIIHFRRQIEAGHWRLNEKVPALEKLARDFGVTRATVRQAIGLLQTEGLLNSSRGRGTYVVSIPRPNVWQPLLHSWKDLIAQADIIEGDILELPQPIRLPDSPQTHRGILAPSYHVVRRLLRCDGIPYLVGTAYVDQRIVDEVPVSWPRNGSIYRAIEQSRLSRPTLGHQMIMLTAADAEIAYCLKVPLGAPIVHVVRRIFDQNDTLIYQSEGQFRSDFIEAFRELK
jgi:GntR family transcriptional regulator